MIWYVAGLVWVIQILFWGLGLTLLCSPPRWRRFWPAFCAPAGLALQSLVVWIGAHTLLRGTDSYAVASQVIPAGLLLGAWWHLRRRGGTWRLVTGTRRWWAVALLMAISLSLQVYPLTKPPGRLTSAALGSCDSADYAAGARVFKEFARNDRSGFIGNPDIARSLPVDNFFDFWLRINHFSPSAVIALNASLSGRRPYELTTLLGIVLLTLHLPGVFWLARSAFRFRPPGSVAVTAIYGFSPIMYYTVYQTALGQLMAAQAVALLTWAGWQAFRGAKTRRLATWSGLLLVGDWLLFGSYNFFILFAYLPLLAYVGMRTLRTRDWNAAWRWLALIVSNLGVCAVLFPDRVLSIVERFRLFNQTAFGWSIPGFWPSGWYGAFANVRVLSPVEAMWGTVVAGVGLSTALVASLRQTARGRWRASALALCCTVPILLGYWYLLRADRLRFDHSSYDAFKLFTVFYPGILVALCLSLRGPHTGGPWRLAAVGWWAVLLGVNVACAWQFNLAVRRAPLIVDPDLAALSEIERMPAVGSVNVLVAQTWTELWANCFLLHKKQYFDVATYEGRAVTARRGQWDLTDRLVSARVGASKDLLKTNRTFALCPHQNDPVLEVKLGAGWNPTEHVRGETWCWGEDLPTIRVDHPRPETLPATLSFSVYSRGERHLRLTVGGQVLWEGVTGPTVRSVDGLPLLLPPGETLVRFETPEAPDRAPDDARRLTFRLSRLQIDAPEPERPADAAAGRD